MKFLKAFTLAETLMVIGLIGVVAALTLPNLSSRTNDKEYVAALQKTVANLQKSLDLAKDKYGDFSSWTLSAQNDTERAQIVGDRLSDYLIPMKVCGTSKGCFSSSAAKAIAGNDRTSYDSVSNTYKYILKDGTSMAFAVTNNDSRTVYVDLDGPNKGYNTNGRDLFKLHIDESGNVQVGIPHEQAATAADKCRDGSDEACAFWVTEFDNNDYVRCAGLSADNITCK
ncbi:type II secretion system protein [bacterium]|nr:type II secretion system protein [bacterium]